MPEADSLYILGGSGMNIPKIFSRGKEMARHLIQNPADLARLPAWFRLRAASPLDAALPWLPFEVTQLLDQKLAAGGTVFEFGGGGSTKWFVNSRADKVITVEHDPEWTKILSAALPPSEKHELIHIDLRDDDGGAYVRSIRDLPDDSVDVVVVDGRHRVRCAEEAAPKVRSGGYIVFDDIDRDRYGSIFNHLALWQNTRISGLCPGKVQLGHVAVFKKP